MLELFLRQLYEAGGAIPPSQATGYTVPFDPEQYKLVALDLLDDAGVRFLLHALASGVVGDSEPEGVVFETKSGPLVIRAQTIVDCTGDGDVAAAAGARFEVGRDEDQLVQPMTLMFRMAGFDRGPFAAYVRQHPDEWRGVLGLWDLIREAQETGELELPREDLLFFATPHEQEVSVNSTRVTGVLGTDAWQLSEAEWIARRQMRQIARFLRNRVPGFADSYIAQSGTTIGVRETRRIAGEYQLTGEDVIACRQFQDAIARGSYPIDIHDPKGKGTVLKRLPAGGAYDIPLRCLIPRAGRAYPARRTVHLRHPRSALFLPRHSDRDGNRTRRRHLRRTRSGNQPAAAERGSSRCTGRAHPPRRQLFGRKPSSEHSSRIRSLTRRGSLGLSVDPESLYVRRRAARARTGRTRTSSPGSVSAAERPGRVMS